MIEIRGTKIYRGPNVWARTPVIHISLDIGELENRPTNAIPGFYERLTELVGEEVVRVWRLYLVGGSMAFRDGRMGVDQILMVRPGAAHSLPAVRTT